MFLDMLLLMVPWLFGGEDSEPTESKMFFELVVRHLVRHHPHRLEKNSNA